MLARMRCPSGEKMKLRIETPAPGRRSSRSGRNRRRPRACPAMRRSAGRVFLLRGKRIGAIGQEDIGGALRDELAIERASLRAGRAGGPAGELQRLLLQRGLGARLDASRLCGKPPRRSRRTDRLSASRCRAPLGVEHAVKQRGRLNLQAGPDQRAQSVAREQHDGAALARCASACGCSMLAEANSSRLCATAISSFSNRRRRIWPGPLPRCASKAFATSVRRSRRLPAA